MNKPACRAYGAAILPTFLHSRPNPKFNPKTKPNTNPIAADSTLNYRQAARHPNRLRSPFCTNTRSSTAHQQQVHNIFTTPTSPQLVVQQIHNKSYKWSVGFNVNGRTFRVIGPSDVSNGIHTSHRHTDGAQVCQAAYTISKDVRHSLTSLIGSATPPLPF